MYGKWAAVQPSVLQNQVADHLHSLERFKGISILREMVLDSEIGLSIIIINARKCIHVVKLVSAQAV